MNVAIDIQTRHSLIPLLLLILSAAACSQNLGSPPSAPERTDNFKVVSVVVDQARGVDQKVRYERLTRFGPWDDRNYQLTSSDVVLLQRDRPSDALIPAFYRVEIRKAFLELGQTIERYPRSSFARFIAQHGGFDIRGYLYQDAERTANGFQVVDKTPIAPKIFKVTRMRPLFNRESRISPSNRPVQPWGDSAVAISPGNANRVIAASVRPRGNQVMHYSSNGGQSWSPASRLPHGDSFLSPTVAWAAGGHVAYATSLGDRKIHVYQSIDGGQNWRFPTTQRDVEPGVSIGNFADQPRLHVDTHLASPFRHRLHLVWSEGNFIGYAYSIDRGRTWSQPQLFDQDPGTGADVATGPSGEVRIAYRSTKPNTNGRFAVRLMTSVDGGDTFGPGTDVATTSSADPIFIPAARHHGVAAHVSTAVDLRSGRIYIAWTDTAPLTSKPATAGTSAARPPLTRIQVAVSRDEGNTWLLSGPEATTGQSTVDHFHAEIGIDRGRTAHLIFRTTDRDQTRNLVDMTHSASYNGGKAWSRPARQTSSASPKVHTTLDWGDRFGFDVHAESVITTFVDNRVEGEPTGGDSRDLYAIRRHFIYRYLHSDGFEVGNALGWTTVNR